MRLSQPRSRWVAAEIDFHKHLTSPAALACLSIDCLQQPPAVEGMKERHKTKGLSEFISLQMSDQMPTGRRRCVRQLLGLLPKQLRSAFSQITAACIEQHLRGWGIHIFSNAHQSHA